MIQRLLILCYFLLIGLYCTAQDSAIPKPVYDSVIKVTVVPNGRYSSVLYTTSDNIPLSPKGIEQRVIGYTPSAQQFEKYTSAKHSVLIFGGGACASFIGAGIEHKNNIGAAKVFLGIGIFGLVMEIINAVAEGNHWDRSIELFNHHIRG